ncbi:hypothetical protein NQ314_016297 [Rhamnusium bicolor]|uniref:Nipped-B protein n=1 Tax=Rhamnusium bicolor TaxID=1586634 RepID=A0AAV8WX75_9CUCU|nr:hypothetical protein NQ314_016297 [Rhamnusium bicolor]
MAYKLKGFFFFLVLPEMPLPTPSPQTLSNKSLLFHPRVAEEAQNLLGVRDEVLVPQLVSSLEKTSAEHIEVKDNYAGADSRFEQQESMPELLRALLEANPYVFSGNKPSVHTSQNVLQQTQMVLLQSQQAQLQNQQLQQQQHIVHQHQLEQQQQQQQQQLWNHTGQPTIQVMKGKELDKKNIQQASSVRLPNQQISNLHMPGQQAINPQIPSQQSSSVQPPSQQAPNLQTSGQQSTHLSASSQQTTHIQTPTQQLISAQTTTRQAINQQTSSQQPQTVAPTVIQGPNEQKSIVKPSQNEEQKPQPIQTSTQPSINCNNSHVSENQPVQPAPSGTSELRQLRRNPTRCTADTTPNDSSALKDALASKNVSTPKDALASKDAPISKDAPASKDIRGTALAKTDPKPTVTEIQTSESAANIRSTRSKLKPEETQQASLDNVAETKSNTEVGEVNAEATSKSDDVVEPKVEIEEQEHSSQHSDIKQPIIKLDRLSEEDQILMQKSLREFIETKPKLAKNLGIALTKNNKVKDENYKEESESEEEETSTRRRREKRKNTESDDEYQPDTFSALVSSNKRRKLTKEEKPDPIVVKPKLRRVEKKFVPVLEKLSQEELMETNTYHRFNKSIELVLKSAEDIDVSEIAEDGMIQEEYLLSRTIMQELCTEAAKLKILGAMEMIPTEKLTRLLNILELNIRGGDRVSPITDEDNESIRQLWLETAMERVMGAADACLVCMYIMTSRNMSKRVYLEEVIDRVVLYIKYQLHNTIFPSFDSTYRLDNKKKDGRRKKNTQVSEKGILVLYTKISELVNLLAELLNIQILTDTSVLHASSMGVSPFFAENVSELQLACLKLVTTIFTKYETHRRLLLDDILASIARLPSTKRSLRTYRLNSEEHIQMLTALVLQLIQCVVSLPNNFAHNDSKDKNQSGEKVPNVDKDVFICNKYEKATSTAGTFLTVFLNKCGSKSEDIDYRPLFENFVQDLLSTVNKPEWPATELLLCLLGKMLVTNFSNKGTDMSLRVASLDYLGVVAARLRRDSVLSRCKLNTIDQMIKDIKQEEMKDNEEPSTKVKKKSSNINSDEERTQFLQRVLLDFLAVNAQNDEAYKYARHFYISQWYKDAVTEKTQIASGDKKNNTRDNHRTKRYEESDESDTEKEKEKDKKESADQENAEKFRLIEEKKRFLINKIKPFQETISSGNRVQIFQTYIDYNSAELIAQFLASKRYFSQSFDQYLKAILIVLKETSIAIRTKAMKCLTMIVEADPSVLGRHDMQMGVNHSFLDHSTSVREAAVDLVGKFVLSRPELINKYYEMLSARILDTGVSVRKRVIKILKDICIECPEFPKIPEICVKMIRRVNDEEGIRKLVMEVFQNMWFTPTKDTSLLRKVMHITDVVASSKEIGLEWFEQLLLSLFKPKEDKDDSTKIATEPPKALLLACRQIVDCLIENVLSLEESTESSGSSQRLVACLTTLHLFAKIRPQLLVKHASTLQPYLGLKCQSSGDIQIISSLEEDAMKLVLQHDRPIVSSCLSCLGSIINKVTHNYQLIRDCFKKYYEYLIRYKTWVEMDYTKCLVDIKYRALFRRALFIVGLLLRHFDFKDPDVIGDLPADTKDQVYQTMTFFLQRDDIDIQANTLKRLDLTSEDAPLRMKVEVLINIENYLVEEENRMIQQDLEWSKRSKEENLKEMGDVSSGMASTVIQLYLKEIMQSYLHHNLQVRQPALRVIQLVLQQGLVHPVQIVPYLICMSTDCEKLVSHSADKQLLDIEKKYPGFIHTKSSLGIRLSYQLQKILQGDVIVRGSRVKEQGEYPSALNGYLYSILRSSRQQRRALILNILKQFDEQARTTLSYMLYLSDNMAYFPYQVQDEPLFIVHHIDIMISVSGTNLLQSFREGLIMTDGQNKILDSENGETINAVSALDEDDDDEEILTSRVPEDASQLQACITAAQGCLLLLMLKQHIKDVYGLSDGKIQQYSPSEPAKVYEKAIARRSNALFNPKATLQKLKEGSSPEYLDEEGRRDLIRQYLDFKQLMLQLDPEDLDEDENAPKVLTALAAVNANPQTNQTGAASSILTEADQVVLDNYKDSPPKVPKLVISNRRFDSDTKRTPRSQRSPEKAKKHRHKKEAKKVCELVG